MSSHILIVEARFYDTIADALAIASCEVLDSAGITYERLSVPGCFEIPAAIGMAAVSGKYDGYIALGCVIRGETSHYDYVCGESARGINELAISQQLAIGYGIITAENRKQADVRADALQKNVGGRAAKACLAMIDIKQRYHTDEVS